MAVDTMRPSSPQSATPKSTSSNQVGWFRRALPLLLVLAGIIAFMYPVMATRHNNAIEEQRSHQYSDSIGKLQPDERKAQLESAREYNRHNVGGPILDPWLARVARDNAPYKNYEEELNVDPNGVMARLVIPGIKVNLPIYHGTDEDTLERGIGHLYGSALPIGGEGYHSVLTGHTGLGTSTLFDNLDKMKEGDAFYIEVMGERLKYQVDQIKVVLPEEIGDLQPIAGQDLITLITCTPYGVNTHRLLVRGHQVPIEPKDNVDKIFDETENSSWTWWMIAMLSTVILVILYVFIRLVLAWRRRRKAQTDGDSDAIDSVQTTPTTEFIEQTKPGRHQSDAQQSRRFRGDVNDDE